MGGEQIFVHPSRSTIQSLRQKVRFLLQGVHAVINGSLPSINTVVKRNGTTASNRSAICGTPMRRFESWSKPSPRHQAIRVRG